MTDEHTAEMREYNRAAERRQRRQDWACILVIIACGALIAWVMI